MARGQMRLKKGWSNCCRMAGIHLWICKATSPGRRCGCCLNQCSGTRIAPSCSSSACVGLLSFYRSATTWQAFYSSTLLPRRAYCHHWDTSTARDVFAEPLSTDGQFPAPQTSWLQQLLMWRRTSRQPASILTIHPPPALRDETGMTHIFSP
jgi:hypothetical protein